MRKQRTLRKQAYSNILKILPPKDENFQIKTIFFHISAQNMNCGHLLEPPQRGGSNEYPTIYVFEQNLEKIMYLPVNPSFTI